MIAAAWQMRWRSTGLGLGRDMWPLWLEVGVLAMLVGWLGGGIIYENRSIWVDYCGQSGDDWGGGLARLVLEVRF